MLRVLVGEPGAGKSYSLLVDFIIPGLKLGRTVVTNLPIYKDRLIQDLEMNQPKDKPLGNLWVLCDFSTGSPIPYPHAFKSPKHWGLDLDDFDVPEITIDHYLRDEKGRSKLGGALFIMDEASRVFSSEMIDKKTSDFYVLQDYIRIHRHNDASDIILCTQSETHLSRNVRDLAGQSIVVSPTYGMLTNLIYSIFEPVLKPLGVKCRDDDQYKITTFQGCSGTRSTRQILFEPQIKYRQHVYFDYYQSQMIGSDLNKDKKQKIKVSTPHKTLFRFAFVLFVFAVYFLIKSFFEMSEVVETGKSAAVVPGTTKTQNSIVSNDLNHQNLVSSVPISQTSNLIPDKNISEFSIFKQDIKPQKVEPSWKLQTYKNSKDYLLKNFDKANHLTLYNRDILQGRVNGRQILTTLDHVSSGTSYAVLMSDCRGVLYVNNKSIDLKCPKKTCYAVGCKIYDREGFEIQKRYYIKQN